MKYNYLDGLKILHYLDFDLPLDKIGRFRENFEHFYKDQLSKSEIQIPILVTITKEAYSSTLSDRNEELEKKLKEVFNKKIFLDRMFYIDVKELIDGYTAEDSIALIRMAGLELEDSLLDTFIKEYNNRPNFLYDLKKPKSYNFVINSIVIYSYIKRAPEDNLDNTIKLFIDGLNEKKYYKLVNNKRLMRNLYIRRN